MSIIAVDPVKNIDFIPASEKKKKDPTTFIVRAMSESEKIEIFDDINPGEDSKLKIPASFFVKLLLKTLSGWKNFNDSSGNPVMYNSRNQKQNIDRIPMDIMIEAGQYVMGLSKFTEQETKN